MRMRGCDNVEDGKKTENDNANVVYLDVDGGEGVVCRW